MLRIYCSQKYIYAKSCKYDIEKNGIDKALKTEQLGAYPSLRRITRSSLERLRSASQRKKLGDKSLFSFVTSAAVAGLTNAATLAP